MCHQKSPRWNPSSLPPWGGLLHSSEHKLFDWPSTQSSQHLLTCSNASDGRQSVLSSWTLCHTFFPKNPGVVCVGREGMKPPRRDYHKNGIGTLKVDTSSHFLNCYTPETSQIMELYPIENHQTGKSHVCFLQVDRIFAQQLSCARQICLQLTALRLLWRIGSHSVILWRDGHHRTSLARGLL